MTLIILSVLATFILNVVSSTETVDIPTSCLGLEDGSYLMKLIDSDDYPIVSADCSNGYMIINYNSDTKWSQYFTSMLKYHYGVVAPERNDLSNWDNWFIPSQIQSDKARYLVSKDCTECDSSSYLQKYPEDSTFYLSALAFGCFNPTRGWPSCDMDFTSYGCRLCH
eukprot:145571_1